MTKALFLILSIGSLCQPQLALGTAKVAQVKKNADGTITELEQKDSQTIVRRTLTPLANGTGILASKTIYTKAIDGVLRNAKIYDGKGSMIFKIQYGYHRINGRLIMEELYDAKSTRLNERGQKIPLQRLYYKYDPQGNRSKPFAITTKKGSQVQQFGSWRNHIQERMDKLKLNFTEDAPTSLSNKQIEAMQKLNRQ